MSAPVVRFTREIYPTDSINETPTAQPTDNPENSYLLMSRLAKYLEDRLDTTDIQDNADRRYSSDIYMGNAGLTPLGNQFMDDENRFMDPMIDKENMNPMVDKENMDPELDMSISDYQSSNESDCLDFITDPNKKHDYDKRSHTILYKNRSAKLIFRGESTYIQDNDQYYLNALSWVSEIEKKQIHTTGDIVIGSSIVYATPTRKIAITDEPIPIIHTRIKPPMFMFQRNIEGKEIRYIL